VLAGVSGYIPEGVVGTGSTLFAVEVGVKRWAVLALCCKNVEYLAEGTAEALVLVEVKVVGEVAADAGSGVVAVGELA
jgi:hypothetical protein